jgi:hypothetical protein
VDNVDFTIKKMNNLVAKPKATAIVVDILFQLEMHRIVILPDIWPI